MLKKFLPSTTVAFVIALGVNFTASADAPQQASTPLKVTTGGYVRFMGGMLHNSRKSEEKQIVKANNEELSKRKRKGDFFLDAKVVIKADGTTNDGIKYGAAIDLLANPSNALKKDVDFKDDKGNKYKFLNVTENPGANHIINADKVYINASKDNIGLVQLGSLFGASYELCYYAPADWGTGGVDGLAFEFIDNEPVDSGYVARTANKALKVAYYTPRVDGFQAGISYAPTAGRRGRFVRRDNIALSDPGTTKLADANFKSVVEYGVNYVNTFDGLGLFLSATGAHGKSLSYPGRSYHDLNSYGFGANLAYSGFTVGGSWANNNRSGYFKGTPSTLRLSNGKEKGWSLGLQYETGPVILGTNFAKVKSANDTAFAGMDKSSVVAGGVTYKVINGVSVYGEVVRSHRHLKRNEVVPAGERKFNKANKMLYLLGTKVDF